MWACTCFCMLAESAVQGESRKHGAPRSQAISQYQCPKSVLTSSNRAMSLPVCVQAAAALKGMMAEAQSTIKYFMDGVQKLQDRIVTEESTLQLRVRIKADADMRAEAER